MYLNFLSVLILLDFHYSLSGLVLASGLDVVYWGQERKIAKKGQYLP